MSNITKLYAAYKTGYLGNNILDTYFSFVANMISEERLTVVEDSIIAAKFKERYTMNFHYRSLGKFWGLVCRMEVLSKIMVNIA